jgi:hypothetical protein
MPNLLCRFGLVGAAVVAALLSASNPAGAEGQRSFVSTSGVDNPTCTIGSPCRSFGAAITATSPGGEVIVLDSGGYGPVTINQSVSIIAPPGVYAGISASTGNGIEVTGTVGPVVVTLRGLTISNIGTATIGIYFHAGSGRLRVVDVRATGFAAGDGLLFVPNGHSELIVEQSSFSGNYDGVQVNGGSIAATKAVLNGVRVYDNSHEGITVVNDATVIVRDSVIASNLVGVGAFPRVSGSSTELTIVSTEISSNGAQGAWAGDPNGTAAMTIDRCTIMNNGTGVETDAAAQVRLAGTVISRNTTGIAYATGGLALSQGNNLIDGNGTDGAAPTVVGSK